MWSLKWQCMCSTLLQQEAGVDWLSNPSLILKSNGWFKKEKNSWMNTFIACVFERAESPVWNRLKEQEEMCFVWEQSWTVAICTFFICGRTGGRGTLSHPVADSRHVSGWSWDCFFFFFLTYFTRGKKKNKSLSDFSSSTQFGSLRAPWKWILLHRKPEDCAVGPHTTVSPPPSALTLLPPELAGVLHFPSLAIRPGVGCLLGVLANLFTLRGWPRGRGGPTSSGRKLPEPSVILQQKLCSRCWSTSPCPCLSKRHYRRLWTTHSKNTGLSGRLCCFPLSHVFIPI